MFSGPAVQEPENNTFSTHIEKLQKVLTSMRESLARYHEMKGIGEIVWEFEGSMFPMDFDKFNEIMTTQTGLIDILKMMNKNEKISPEQHAFVMQRKPLREDDNVASYKNIERKGCCHV